MTATKNGQIGLGNLGYGTMQIRNVSSIGQGLEARYEENIFANNKPIVTLGKSSIFNNPSLNNSFVKDYNLVPKDASLFSGTQTNNNYSNSNYSVSQLNKQDTSAPASTGVNNLCNKLKSIFS